MLRSRPSELLALSDDPYLAYCFDQATVFWGQYVESELDKVSHKPTKEEIQSKAAREKRLTELLELEDKPQAEQTGRFMDPAALFS